MSDIESLIAELRHAYAAKHSTSADLHEEATRVMPGGNSRSQLHFEPFPFYVDRAVGPYLYDVDGHRYLDVVNNYTSLVHGHPDEATVEVIRAQAERGTAYAAPSPLEIDLATEITRRVTSIEEVRFTNSGSEAVLYALRLARHVTGRPDVIKVEGGYHGGNESVQVSVKHLGERWSESVPEEGVPSSVSAQTHIIPFDDVDGAVEVIRKVGPTSAALIVEPIQGFGGALRAPDGYLEAISKTAADCGVLTVFDEIQTLRFAYGGYQQTLGLTPDLTVLGKLIGGGLPVGAFGGSTELMAATDPRKAGSMTHSGTFNANPLTMAAGLHALRRLTPEAIERLNTAGNDLREWINNEAVRLDLPFKASGYGSMLQIHVGSELPSSYREARTRPISLQTALFYLLMQHGVFTAPSRAMFALSTAIRARELEEIKAALTHSLERLVQASSRSSASSRASGEEGTGDHDP